MMSSTPPHHTPPYVIETNNTANNANGVVTGVWLTVPKHLPIPEGHRHLENEIFYYCHTILQGEFNKKHDRDKTTRINRKLMQSILGNASKETQARQWLLEGCDPRAIYTDHVYSQGNFSKSYGLNPLYRTPLMRWQVTNPRLAHRLRLARLRRLDIRRDQEERQPELLDCLEQWAKRITIDLDGCRRDLERSEIEEQTYHLMPAENIRNRDYHLTRDDYGRVHSPYTQLWRPFRKHLRYDIEPLQETDIRNSQIVFLVKLLKEHLLSEGKDATADQAMFVSLVEQGHIYDHLLAKAHDEIEDYLRRAKVREARKAIWHERFLIHTCASVQPRNKDEWASARRAFLRQVPLGSIEVVPGVVDRDDFKRMLFADVFYGRPKASTALTELFRAEFPAVYDFICDQKRECYQDLARKMQRAEAHLMIDTVCLRLMKHHPEIPVVTIHDSILTTSAHLPAVKRIILEEFARSGLQPTLK